MMKTAVLITFIMLLFTEGAAASGSERQGPPLIVGYDPDMPPLHYNDDGAASGFAVDLTYESAKQLGRDVRFVEVPRRDGREALDTGEVDVLLSAYFNEEDAGVMEFADPYIKTSVGLYVHEDNESVDGLADLGGIVTALETDTLEYDFLRNIRGVHYHTATSQEKALELLLKGRAEAFVGNVLTASYILEQSGRQEEFQTVGSYLLPVEYSMVVQGENYLLVDQLNRALRDLRGDGTYNRLYTQWFDQDDDLTGRLWLALQVIGTLLVAIVVLLLVGVKWNRQLKKEVRKKTNVLNELNQSLRHQVKQTKSSDEFKKQILNSSPRGIATVDREGIVTSFNTKAKEMAGFSEEAVARHFTGVRILNQLLGDKFEDVFTRKKLYLGEGAEWERGDGSSYFLRYYVYPLYDLNKKMTGIIVTFEDVTEEKKLRQQIFEQEKNQALGRVVAGIAHEIRNPLTSIKTFVELIPLKFSNERFQKEISTYVPQEIERVNTLIEGLIDYAKPKQADRKIINVGPFLDECTILFKRTANNSGFQMKCESEEDLFIEADENQLKQVIINLVLNGIDAMETVGAADGEVKTLTLTACQKWNQVIITVKDEGEGMSREQQKQALEPFFTTKAKGTGLGLAIAQQYIRDNNGQMRIDSIKGKGTSIVLTFDRVKGGREE
ncbi:transporter substrate-binding domain-containing protein [Alteribacter natronophilus]|uniref:transporter substrate-binding domain-containing protein n=1 Tax=Alteribacter natronophilus TaxID=2583810 RepID=UPI00110EB1D5|nr:transporter substrate-binding domain-containing protein [Alteribacter natronophilus]TMW69989.1 transporter substrate-binding domain-containing protein [Alteribacter natronophilus]